MIALFANLMSLPRWVQVIIGLIALSLAAFTLHRCGIDAVNEEGVTFGVTKQSEANLTETVKNVEKANAAAETVVRDVDAARAECLRNARNPANC